MNLGGWTVDETHSHPHVRPVADYRPHTLYVPCWCKPTLDDGVYVHHSMDRREEYEEGRPLS